jgi:hypothetical protein
MDDYIHIPLDRALLCADCNTIYELPRDRCPSCTCSADSGLLLGKILGDRNELVTGLQALTRLLNWAGRKSRQK